MNRLDGRVALVTGGLKGIGRATAERMLAEGASVMLADLPAPDAAADVLATLGERAAYVELDVGNEAAWPQAVAAIRDRFGRLDILVANAGIDGTGRVQDMTLAHWHRTMRVNVDGVFLATRHCADLLAEGGRDWRGGASIVNISSIMGLVGLGGVSAYNASKGAVRLFTKSIALEFATAKAPIRVNSVHPGFVETPLLMGTSDASAISATVTAMRAAGAEVIATDLKAPANGDLNLAQDVTDEADWSRVAAEIETRWGRLDALVNNAGTATISPIADNSLDLWRRQMAVNVDSMLLSHQAMLPLLRRSGETRDGGASVVNLSSVGGLGGAPFMAAYCTSKGAVRLFTKSAALEFAALRYNIRVNSVHPGGIDTGMMDEIIAAYVRLGAAPDEQTARAGVDAQHPLARWGRPEEIAGGIVFLCSSAASFMTGSELVIDGGFTAR